MSSLTTFRGVGSAPASCFVNIQGTCIPNPNQYLPPGPPCSRVSCGCGKGSCATNCFNSQGRCPGYHCDYLGGLPQLMDTVDYSGQLVLPWMKCRPGAVVDPTFGVCVPDPKIRPFVPWSWEQTMSPDYKRF